MKTVSNKDSARDIINKMGDIPALKHIPYSEYPSAIHGRMAEELGKAETVQVHYFKSLPPQAAGVYLNVVAQLLAKEISPEDAFKTVEESLAGSRSQQII